MAIGGLVQMVFLRKKAEQKKLREYPLPPPPPD
jgi:hypothetical protein